MGYETSVFKPKRSPKKLIVLAKKVVGTKAAAKKLSSRKTTERNFTLTICFVKVTLLKNQLCGKKHDASSSFFIARLIFRKGCGLSRHTLRHPSPPSLRLVQVPSDFM